MNISPTESATHTYTQSRNSNDALNSMLVIKWEIKGKRSAKECRNGEKKKKKKTERA